MSTFIIQLLLNASPVIFAAIFHMVVVKKGWFKFLTYPLDHFKTYHKKRIFGVNKTYRGLVVMLIASLFFSYLYFLLIQQYQWLQQYNLLYISNFSFVFYGFLFGIGYIVGELPNSFYKRQIDVKAGKSNSILMIIMDQLDSVFVIMMLLVAFSNFSWKHFLFGIFFYGFIHIIINYILYLIGLRKEPF